MSSRNWRARIEDILYCIANIQSFVEGMQEEAFTSDTKTIRAVAFELTTMGEAARSIPKDIQNKYPGIPWVKMQNIRNVIVHEYFRLDEDILWHTIKDDLPQLKSQLENIE